jgi:hypothetical protein
MKYGATPAPNMRWDPELLSFLELGSSLGSLRLAFPELFDLHRRYSGDAQPTITSGQQSLI